MLPRRAADVFHQPLRGRFLVQGFVAHLHSFVVTMSHKSSVIQDAKSVSRVLTRDNHESLKNLTPADVYFGRGQTILLQREKIKRQTIQNRRLLHSKKAA
jgi:hypothetical protein